MYMTEAEAARLMKVTEAIVRELDRQGVSDTLVKLKFDALEMARVAIRAADGVVVPFRRP
ncbi:hypothetical protein [Bradyrhizobium brasilense]|uniref:Helix-turn-helix domain-containing protein n=1 Tax=Bradyrhizobium brasilense TaxID=1419277 RepID=A0ABY8JL77_9BRAD|nr:hypothetical protein [Bradyrhizobium brasilense]WFU66201.1 hypothetical protein QA636_12090 [Bradyrhizobium brasilense]